MAGAARKMARLYARTRYCIGEQLLKARRALHRRRALHLLAVNCDAASGGDAPDLGHDVRDRGIAGGVIASANVERKLAPTWNYIDRAVGHCELSDRPDKRGRLRAALFDIEDQFGRGRSRIVPPRHGYSSGVTGGSSNRDH